MHNQQQLNNYFSQFWSPRIDHYQYSGWALVDKIKPEESVIDIGCGNNPVKEKIGILVGIDPAFGQADHQTALEDFHTEQRFDVAFCLGSINFGTEETILKQIQLVINLLNPTARIYWRCNPGLKDHGNKQCEDIDFFPWTKQLHKKYAKRFGFELVDIQDDTNNRIYAEWARSNT